MDKNHPQNILWRMLQALDPEHPQRRILAEAVRRVSATGNHQTGAGTAITHIQDRVEYASEMPPELNDALTLLLAWKAFLDAESRLGWKYRKTS